MPDRNQLSEAVALALSKTREATTLVQSKTRETEALVQSKTRETEEDLTLRKMRVHLWGLTLLRNFITPF